MTVSIPSGASTAQIAEALEKKGVIKSAMVFNYYVKFHNYTNFQAGDFSLSKAENLKSIIAQLRGGGSTDSTGTVLVKEGVTAETIADAVDKLKSKDPSFTKANFIKLLKDEKFFDELYKNIPNC